MVTLRTIRHDLNLTKGRTLALVAGSAGLATVAVLGGGVAIAQGGSHTSSSAATTKTISHTAGQQRAAADTTASPSTSASPSASTSGAPHQGSRGGGPGGKGGHGGPGGHGGGPGDRGGRVLHGEFVTESKTGTYVTEDEQSGTVTALSATSITVKSADNYSETYVLTSSTKYGHDSTASDVAVGDSVSVRATVSGGTATATDVDEHKQPTAQPSATASASPTS